MTYRRISSFGAIRAVSALAALLFASSFTAAAASAQVGAEGAVSLPFTGSNLEVRLLTRGAAGVAELLDGEPGTVVVVDRGGVGGSHFELKDATLTVDNRAGSYADYAVTVPPGARVSLMVDGRTVLGVAEAEGGRRLIWRWPGRGVIPAPLREEPPPERAPLLHKFVVNAFVGDLVVDSADVAHLDRVRALKIVIGGRDFLVSGDRSVGFSYHGPSRWGVINPRADGVQVTVQLPTYTPLFKVRVGDVVIWELRDGRARARCEPVSDIRAPDGRQIWLFTPQADPLRCPVEGDAQPA